MNMSTTTRVPDTFNAWRYNTDEEQDALREAMAASVPAWARWPKSMAVAQRKAEFAVSDKRPKSSTIAAAARRMEILAAMAERDMTRPDLWAMREETSKTINHDVYDMEADGLIERTGQRLRTGKGSSMVYRITAAGRAALEAAE